MTYNSHHNVGVICDISSIAFVILPLVDFQLVVLLFSIHLYKHQHVHFSCDIFCINQRIQHQKIFSHRLCLYHKNDYPSHGRHSAKEFFTRP